MADDLDAFHADGEEDIETYGVAPEAITLDSLPYPGHCTAAHCPRVNESLCLKACCLSRLEQRHQIVADHVEQLRKEKEQLHLEFLELDERAVKHCGKYSHHVGPVPGPYEDPAPECPCLQCSLLSLETRAFRLSYDVSRQRTNVNHLHFFFKMHDQEKCHYESMTARNMQPRMDKAKNSLKEKRSEVEQLEWKVETLRELINAPKAPSIPHSWIADTLDLSPSDEAMEKCGCKQCVLQAASDIKARIAEVEPYLQKLRDRDQELKLRARDQEIKPAKLNPNQGQNMQDWRWATTSTTSINDTWEYGFGSTGAYRGHGAIAIKPRRGLNAGSNAQGNTYR